LTFDQQIKASISKIHPFTEDHLQLFMEKISLRSLKKNEYLLSPPKTCSFFALVLQGNFRMFKPAEDKENTLHFFTDNDWVADFESFVAQKPTVNYIQAMGRAEVALLSINDIHQLIHQSPAFLIMGKVMKGWSISTLQYTSLINDTPEERYRLLMATHPDWILRFPQMHLASYLGMSRETFSRVKKKTSLVKRRVLP
jgi:CRP-like cAMP-binding protein